MGNDAALRATVRSMLEDQGWAVEGYGDGMAFLAALQPGREGCLLVDAAMPGMDEFEVLQRRRTAGHRLPAIVITGHGDVPAAMRAMKAGALDFIEKPVRAPDRSHANGTRSNWHLAAAASIASLTRRRRDVMAMVLAGHSSKDIAADLGITQRTVKNHRDAIMRKTGVKSLPALARLAMAAVA